MKNSDLFSKLKPLSLGKGQQRQQAIILKTIELGAQYGFEFCTFEKIAKEVESTRPLLNHYFKTRENLFMLCAQYIRLKIQESVVQKMQESKDTKFLILTYIKANFDWYKNDKSTLKFYFQYLNYAMFSPDLHKQNISYVDMGLKRIEEILELGLKNEEFVIENNITVRQTARTIQLLITGALISLVTENPKDDSLELKSALDQCHLLLKFKK